MIPKVERIVAVIFVFLIGVFSMQFTQQSPSQKLVEKITKDLGEFHLATVELKTVGENFKFDRAKVADLKEAITKARCAYKKVEFLLEYYYPSYVEEHINGAPLLHIEHYDTRPFVLPPEGLQVLDELIYSEDTKAEKLLIATLTQKLETKTAVLTDGFKGHKIKDEEVLEAIRLQLVRSFTLGLTGFDTPGSLNAIEEATISMQALKDASIPFIDNIDENTAKGLTEQFDEAITYLKNSKSFDDFNRLEFLKAYVNPLFLELYTLKEKLKISSHTKTITGVNKESTNIFANNFLDPYFYTQLNKNEDSEALHRLGEKFFYDPILSSNGQMSCGTCHNPQKAFTDGKPKSESSIVGETVQRNSPTLLNAVYADRYFYDLRAFTLEQQAEHVVFNQKEFNTAYDEITAKLNESDEYKELIKEVFKSKKITRDDFVKALASYVLSLQSFNSEFDKYVRGEVGFIDPKIEKGFNLFMGKASCGTCHFAPTFSGLVPPLYAKNESEILGVLKKPRSLTKELDEDMGRYENQIYSEKAWIYERSFKTTTLRNIELTAPYFHNGGYKTLESVVDFYNDGGGAGMGFDVKNQTLPATPLGLTIEEKEFLVLFMQSLTDTTSYRNTY